MPQSRFTLIDVFASRPLEGNLLAVAHAVADHLDIPVSIKIVSGRKS